jgi:hypothetical protein
MTAMGNPLVACDAVRLETPERKRALELSPASVSSQPYSWLSMISKPPN